MTETPEPLSLPEDGTRVKATTLGSLEYDEEPEEIEGILTKIGSPFSNIPNCWVDGREVDPASVSVATETGLAEG